jgi:hypothetical protein
MTSTFDVDDWPAYFRDFSSRNLGRVARLEIFGELGALMEVRRMPLGGVSVDMKVADAPRVDIMLGGLSAKFSDSITHSIPYVSAIMALAASDKSENAIEFQTSDGVRTLLSFETQTFVAAN